MLIRRADFLLVKQWSNKHSKTYDRISGLLAKALDQQLAGLFQRRGCEAWSNVAYARTSDRRKSDIDVLVKDPDDHWLVVEAKNLLAPSPTSESVYDRSEYYKKGIEQINDALDTLRTAPRQIYLASSSNPLEHRSIKGANGLYVATHSYGAVGDKSIPSIELWTLKMLLQELRGNISIPQLIDVISHRAPQENIQVFTEVLAASGFLLRIPYLRSGGRIWNLVNKILAGLIFAYFRCSYSIRRRSRALNQS